jgi:micrococcal nuclease
MRPVSKRTARIGISFLIAFATLLVGNNVAQNTPSSSFKKTFTKKHAPQIKADAFYSVTHVVDGDTVDVDINGETERIRLIGLDTPETVDPRKPVQCFGKEASDKAKDILTGQKVKIETDPTQGTRDKYGRLLAYVFLPDGTLFNKTMIEKGYGHEYTYHLPYKYQIEFKAAQMGARDRKVGLWADDACKETI